MKINSRIHGLIDYIVVLFLWSSPSLFSLPEETSMFTYILGLVHLILTLSTKFELGVVRIISLRVHGIVELIVSIVLVAVAFYLGDREGIIARNFYLLFALAVFVTWLVSDYRSATSR